MNNAANRFFMFLTTVTVFLLVLMNAPQVQARTIKLTYASLNAPTHPIAVATKHWADRIEKESNGQIKIKIFWAGALYRPRASAVELGKGVADMGDFSGAYSPVGFDIEKSMRMAFWGLDDRKTARLVYYSVKAKFPQIEQEFTDAGIKVLCYAAIPPYQILTTRKRVTSIDDLKGLTFKASGDFVKAMAAIGAEGIVMPITETYTSLQKNTIDGIVIPYETLKSFRFNEVVKYALEINVAAAPAGRWGINLKKWRQLPEDAKKVFEDNIEWFGEETERLIYANSDEAVELGKESGIEFIKLSLLEMKDFYAVVDKTILERMASVDKKGIPGTEIYKEMRRLIDQYIDH